MIKMIKKIETKYIKRLYMMIVVYNTKVWST
jgi:hypothetical protein